MNMWPECGRGQIEGLREAGFATARYYWCRKEDSNLRPIAYEATALPTELFRHVLGGEIIP